MSALHESKPLQIISSFKCPCCGSAMVELRRREGVMSRIFKCGTCKPLWFPFGDRLFRCVNADALLVPGQL